MTDRLTRPCPTCGADASDRALAAYEPAPNDAQRETEWGADLPELHGLVCTECGRVLATISTRDPDEIGAEERRTGGRFRIDRELE